MVTTTILHPAPDQAVTLGPFGVDIYAGDEGHVYAVQPQTRAGRAITRYSPDPHYARYGGGAYRTTGQLRVLHEVDEPP